MTPSAPTSLSTITHWIGGKPWNGPADRWGDVYNPAQGEPSARVAFADAATVDAAVAGRAGRGSNLGPNVAWPPARASCSRSASSSSGASVTLPRS